MKYKLDGMHPNELSFHRRLAVKLGLQKLPLHLQSSSRRIEINRPEANAAQGFVGNSISTSKYTVFSFPVKFIREQFSKVANIFFLFVILLQAVPKISPTSKFATAVPFAIVLGVTAIKEISEDRRRHKSDAGVNAHPVRVLRGKKFIYVRWDELVVGDIVRLVSGDTIPADLVILSSSEPDGICYTETSNLDGETNLKIKQGRKETASLVSPSLVSQIDGFIECEHPNNSLYTFEGRFISPFLNAKAGKDVSSSDAQAIPLDPMQILLRGAQIRNTQWLYAIVIYTGHDSKLLRNATATPIKRTSVEKLTNIQVACLFFLLLLLALISSVGYSLISLEKKMWYLKSDALGWQYSWFGQFLTAILLLNNIIPISLIVTTDLVKSFLASFINSDVEMYDKASDTPAQCRMSSLVEELGRVRYIFSDKTGTLTCNIMEFRQCCIGGIRYGGDIPQAGEPPIEQENYVQSAAMSNDTSKSAASSPLRSFGQLIADLGQKNAHAKYVAHFLTLLSTCHTVIPEVQEASTSSGKNNEEFNKNSKKDKTEPSSPLDVEFTSTFTIDNNVSKEPQNFTDAELNEIKYQASSPDEGALVGGARGLGYIFHTRRPTSITVRMHGVDTEVQVLNICEFNSTRKRMSAVLRFPDGNIILYCKGADTVILERLDLNTTANPHVQSTLEALDEYASEGLRTLCLAYRIVPETEYIDWAAEYDAAAASLESRGAKLDAAAEKIERNLLLIGATAIEDKLQDGVPESIATLASAGIKIWVLTGDRQETAINIGYSCKLLNEDMNLLVFNSDSLEEVRSEFEKQIQTIWEFLAKSASISNGSGGKANNTQLWGKCERMTHALKRKISLIIRKLKTKFLGYQHDSFGSQALLEGSEISLENIALSKIKTANALNDISSAVQTLDNLALIIDGATLKHALDPTVENLFFKLASICKAVICCRVSPLQKALVVKLVKRHTSDVLLAIGDGANDVTMIQAAHVGVGISGQEGLQAARSADFSIAQFRFLNKLLLVHGTWAYSRLSNVILYSFFKNVALYVTQFWFLTQNGFSGQTLFESWLISLFNVCFTALPPFALGIFDQYASPRMIERYPQLYGAGQRGEMLNVKLFWLWVGNAALQSLILYICTTKSFGTEASFYNGKDVGMWPISITVYSAVLTTVLIKACLVTSHWTKWAALANIGSIFFWYSFVPIYVLIIPYIFYGNELYGSVKTFSSGNFWLIVLCLPLAALFPDIAWSYYQRTYHPKSVEVVQEIQKFGIPDYRPRLERFRKALHKVRAVQRMRKSHGFAFSQNDSGQADLIRVYDTTRRKPRG